MTPVPLALSPLHRAWSSPRPAGLTPSDAAGLGFADLLGRARAGALDSGRTVTLAGGVRADLNPEQWARVGAAVDRAEAAGAAVAMVLVDGAALTVDVLRREVTAAGAAEPGRVHTGVDAVVVAAPSPGGPPPAPAGPAPLPPNPALARLLSRAGTDS